MSPNIDSPDSTGDQPRPELSRAERERLARRRDIIKAARTEFACNGFEKTTLGDVARRAEFGTGTIYNYFPNKERLFECVIEEAFLPIRRIAEEAFQGEDDFERRLARFVDDELVHFFDHPATLRLLLRESHQLRERNPMQHLAPLLLDTVAEAIAAEQHAGGIVDDLDARDLATALLNMLYGQFISRVYKSKKPIPPPDELAAEASAETSGQPSERPSEQSSIEWVFRPLPPEERAREIARMSHLVRTLFLNGSRRK